MLRSARGFCTLIALIALFCAGLIVAVRLGSRIAPLRAAYLLTNPDGSPCTAPCILGIIPGKMTYRQAVSILRRHPLLAPHSMDESLCQKTFGWCTFKLRGFGDTNGIIYGVNNENLRESNVVNVVINFDTPQDALTLGDFIAAFGLPQDTFPNPQIPCCAPQEVQAFTNKLLEVGAMTFGFSLYFPDRGLTVQDRIRVDNGLYRLGVNSNVGRLIVASPDDICARAKHYLDRWYGFASLPRYFSLPYQTC